MAKLVHLLQKMGLVEVSPTASSTSKTAQPATERVADATTAAVQLTPPGPPPDFDAAFADARAQDDEVDFRPEDIYASAGIEAPAHGFTVFKLIEMMQGEEVVALAPETAAKVITGLLRHLPSGAVAIDDIVRDAVARDQALDAFEQFLGDRVAATVREVETANRDLQEEIDELTRKNNAAMEANRARVEREKARLARWRSRKQVEEDRLFNAVQPFVETNPVSRSRDGE